MPPSARPVTPAAAASCSASRNTTSAPCAYASTLRTDVSPDAALGRVDDALPADLVVGVRERAQVRERVLDLAPVVELRAADDAVRHPGADERLLHDAALRVRPVEDGDVAVADLLDVDEPVDLVHHEVGLVVLVLGVVAGDELAADLLGPEVLRPARRVVGDDRVGGVEDRLARPVVLVEHDDRRLGELLLEPHQVPVVRPAELVDRL